MPSIPDSIPLLLIIFFLCVLSSLVVKLQAQVRELRRFVQQQFSELNDIIANNRGSDKS